MSVPSLEKMKWATSPTLVHKVSLNTATMITSLWAETPTVSSHMPNTVERNYASGLTNIHDDATATLINRGHCYTILLRSYKPIRHLSFRDRSGLNARLLRHELVDSTCHVHMRSESGIVGLWRFIGENQATELLISLYCQLKKLIVLQ